MGRVQVKFEEFVLVRSIKPRLAGLAGGDLWCSHAPQRAEPRRGMSGLRAAFLPKWRCLSRALHTDAAVSHLSRQDAACFVSSLLSSGD